MLATYNVWLVALSILVAVVVSYTSLRLVGRITETHRSGKRLWLLGGAVVMGMGIWSMHFIGMLAFSLPIPLRYSIGTTLASLAIAVVTSGFALSLASGRNLYLRGLLRGSIVMGAGICAMHYTGMAAIEVVPMISYEPWRVAASVVIAVTASFAALWLAFNLRTGSLWLAGVARIGAATVMGLAISGMHYTAMAASRFAPGSFCRSGTLLDGGWLAGGIGLVALSVLAITLITAVYDAHLESQTLANAKRLEQVNAELQHGKKLLALATQAAGISSWEFDLHTRTTLWRENEIEALRECRKPGEEVTPVFSAILPADIALASECVSAAHAAGQDRCSFRLRSLTPSGRQVTVQSHARIVCDEQGEPCRLLGVSWDVTEQIIQEDQRRQLEDKLREASREAGMAEIASNVLHNVGNVLNSVNVSAGLVTERLKRSKGAGIARVAALLDQHAGALGPFLESAQGRHLPTYMRELAGDLAAEQDVMTVELGELRRNLEHIKEIVATQQNYARRGGLTEVLDVRTLVEHSLRMNEEAFTRHGVTLVREFSEVPPVRIDKHKVLQILVNLIGNAKHAFDETSGPHKRVTVRIARNETSLLISVIDTGVGIAEENLTRIFNHGFTTRASGHGFGLHSSALAATESGGSLRATSAGLGKGANFTLELPLSSVEMLDVA